MAQGDPMKWHMPGWRIEQRFAPGVLIGNWSEERYTVSFLQRFKRTVREFFKEPIISVIFKYAVRKVEKL